MDTHTKDKVFTLRLWDVYLKASRQKTMASRVALLHEAMNCRQLVRISRRFEQFPVRGYVLDIGPKFFLLALVCDRVRFDGFECFRIGDVLSVKPDPYARFIEAALRKRQERRPRKPQLDLASVENLLASAGHKFPLVTIHREKVTPDICHIGRVLEVQKGNLALLEIGPDATWEDIPMRYRLREITRVNFGGEYENALRLVGGNPAA